MEYYFFRDLDNRGNADSNLSFHAAGLAEVYNKTDKTSENGKDVTVWFVDPFTGYLNYTWRSFNGIELFKVTKEEFMSVRERYNLLEV